MVSFKPRSGYDLRRDFVTNLRYYSDSPGSIYPALRRLEARGWVERVSASGEGGKEGRSRQPFTLTEAGRQELVRWLEEPLAEADVETRLSDRLLRFAFMDRNVPRTVTIEFLRKLEEGLAARASRLRRRYDEMRANWPVHTGILSMLLGVETMEAQARWAGTARAELETSSPPGAPEIVA